MFYYPIELILFKILQNSMYAEDVYRCFANIT